MTTSTTRYPGIDRHGDKVRVRVLFPAPWGRYSELVDDEDDAIVRRAELKKRAKAGLPPVDEDDENDPTLAEALASLAKQKRANGGRGVRFTTETSAFWLASEWADRRLSTLRRAPLEDAIVERAGYAPTAARNERQTLIAALELAGDRGASVDARILRIPPRKVTPAVERRALSKLELEFFVRHAPALGRRLILLQGTVGNRIGELFLAEPEHFDLDATELVDGVERPVPTMFVPAANCKERRDKWVPLTPEEVLLVREQLGGLRVVDESSATSACPAMPAGGRYLFGMVARAAGRHPGGPTRWYQTNYDRLVWGPAVEAAAAAWRAENELAPVLVGGELRPAPTPFEWYVDPASAPPDARRKVDDGRRWIGTHDLRATAVTMMRDLDIARDICAARVGHADAGKLVDAIYDQGSKAKRVGRALYAVAPEGLRAAIGARG